MSEAAILRTVLYASVFEHPLLLSELHDTLEGVSLTEAEILKTFDGSPRLQAALEYKQGLFFPRGQAAWIDERRRRETRRFALAEKHRRLLRTVCALPFVRMVALSDGMATQS